MTMGRFELAVFNEHLIVRFNEERTRGSLENVVGHSVEKILCGGHLWMMMMGFILDE